jgi:hypothetical protein
MQRLEVDLGLLERSDKKQRAALVLEKKILGVAARNLAAQELALLNREQGRMLHGGVPNAQPIEESEQIVWTG